MSETYLDKQGHLTDAGLLLVIDCWKKEEELPESIRLHLDTCADCREELVDYRLFLGSVEGEKWEIREEDTSVKPRRHWYLKIAAALLILAVFSWLASYLMRTEPAGGTVQERVLVLKEQSDLPFWDDVIENDRTSRGKSFEVISPKTDTVLFTNQVIFHFKGTPVQGLVLELFNKANEENPDLFSISQGQSVYQLDDVPEGLYYWRLLGTGPSGRRQRLSVGRFYVLNP